MTERGKALLIPTIQLRGGQVQRHGRWEHGAAFLTGTLLDVVQRFVADGFQKIHTFFDDGPTVENRRAIHALSSAGAVVIAEGGLREVSNCLALAEDGHNLQIVEPALLDNSAAVCALAENVQGALLAVGAFKDGQQYLITRVQQALAGSFIGVVLDLAAPIDVDGIGHLKRAIEGRGAELILRAMPPADAGMMQTQLHPIQPLDLTMLLDGEFLIEMLRFNRRARESGWLKKLDSTSLHDRFLVETVRFLRSEMDA